MMAVRVAPRVTSLSRHEFLCDYWDYSPGQHVTILGPTGSGKTQLKWQLLSHTASRDLQAFVLATKPKDKTTRQWSKNLGYPIIRAYPPLVTTRRLYRKPSGYVLWPKHSMNPDVDDREHQRILGSALYAMYRRGNLICDVDEVLDLVDLRLERHLRVLWTRGRSMGVGLWAGTQQPFHIPTHAYRQSQHLFIANDPDTRSRKRYDEIGGIDPGIVQNVVTELPQFHFLYIRRDGRHLCVIDRA